MQVDRTTVLLLVTVLGGCGGQEKGFTLPQGDAERGRETFVAFRCFDCHDVHNVELPARENSNVTIVKLGGEVTQNKTYGDLVTGVINPSHRLAAGYKPSENVPEGTSPMKVYNDVMTVTQLVNIVTFLQQHYKLKPYTRTPYPQLSI
jgi:hypothetical protein